MQKKKECGRERRRDQNDMDRIARVKPTGQQPPPPPPCFLAPLLSLSLPTVTLPPRWKKGVCVSLQAESNRSCEKSFQLMWQNGKARGRRKRRQPIRPEAAIFSPFPSFLLRADGHTGKGFDYENTDMQTDVSIASAYTHILYTNEPREARPPPPPITVGHMCKECVVLIYLLCSVC